MIKDRIKELRRVKASELVANERNWRKHPEHQVKAMRGVLEEIGYADALLARELDDGRLVLIDGHLRKDVTPEMEVPVLVLDVSEAEALKILATHDPLAGMAETDQDGLDSILAEIDAENDALREMLDTLASDDEGDVKLKKLDVRPPPKMAWVLIGIETVRFGEIAQQLDEIGSIDGIIVENTISDGI